MKGMLDRKVERGHIHSFLNSSPSNSQLFWINGPIGSGKTTLLRYIAERYASNVLCLNGENRLLRCNQNEQNKEFHTLSTLVTHISLSNPMKFQKALSISNDIPALPPLWKIVFKVTSLIPGMQQVNGLFDGATRQGEELETKLRNIVTPNLVKEAVYELILDFFTEKVKQSSFTVIIIDDIQWIDQRSLEILLPIINELFNKNHGIYVFMSSHDQCPSIVRDKYIKDLVSDYFYNSTQMISLDNLTKSKMSEIFGEANKELPVDLIDKIYRETEGNFEKLGKILRKSKEEIQEIYEELETKKSKGSYYDNSFQNITAQKPYLIYIFFILSSFKNKCTSTTLNILLDSLSLRLNFDYNSNQLKLDLSYLESLSELKISNDLIECHTERSELAIRMLKVRGKYEKSIIILSQTIIEYAIENDSGLLTVAFSSLKKVNPNLVISEFGKLLLNKYDYLFQREIVVPIGMSALELSNDKVIENFSLLTKLTTSLARKNEFLLAYKLGRKLIRINTNKNLSYSFLYDYMKSMRESGQIKNHNEVKSIYQVMVKMSTNLSENLKAKTLYCSILEHLGKYDYIRKIYKDIDNKTKNLDFNNKNDIIINAIAVRNKGLSEFHGDIINTYHDAYSMLESISSKDREITLLKAALANHCGLANYYRGSQKTAIDFFAQSHNHLKSLSLYLETPINNIACALILSKDYNKALDFIERAEKYICKPIYQTHSIAINKSIIYWELNERNLAINQIEKVINSNNIPDPMILATANVNYGYFLFKENKFHEAALKFKESRKFKYRFLNNEYNFVESKLEKLCLIKDGFLSSEDLGDVSLIDFKDVLSIPHRKIYRPDTNSLYVD
ncbi:AAA family ATPase [Vibrio penaeicida]|uniref:tetratricopeptide repeat protein n=1 Tax=Vibrio penaeicida TaxID=104609 RepID=UPI00273565F6|nr:AAA family ATPase [Vibrio penaeicida]MDP2575066.1 AAA family ATPase [Vibrio penaeicida]